MTQAGPPNPFETNEAPLQPPGPKPPLTFGKIVKRAIGGLIAAALTIVLIGSAFFRPVFEGGFHIVARFPLGEWFASLPSQLWWVVLFSIFTASMAPLRAFRWGFNLPKPKPAYWDRYHSVALGLLGNNVIPGKLGEAIKGMALTRFTARKGRDLPFSQSLGSILVCKLLDLVALLVLVSISPSGPFFGSTDGLSGGLLGVTIAVPLLVAALFLVARFAPRMADWLQRKGRSPKLEGALRGLGVGVAASGSLKSLALAFGATLIAISAVATGYTIALFGVGVHAGVFAGVVLLAAVSLGQSPPGVPAGMGMYYLACTWAARLLGANAEQAATLAVLTHLTTVLTHTLVGAVSLVIRRVKIRDFLPKGRKARAAAPQEVARGAGGSLPGTEDRQPIRT